MIGLDSKIYGACFTDPAITELFTDPAEIKALLEVEASLAKVLGELDIIPMHAALTIQESLAKISIDPNQLAEDCRNNGVIIPGLINMLRQNLPENVAPYLHWGATSQDIIDTALVINIAKALAHLEHQLRGLGDHLATSAEQQKDTVMIARTRAQWATPTLGGLKIANWLAPLTRQLERLNQLKPRVLILQLGGAAGTLAAFGDHGPTVRRALANELGLKETAAPWHTQRDNLVELANWLSMTTGLLAKMGQDLLLLAQSDIAEVAIGSSGKSSTMPHKNNPVDAEILISLARHNAGLMANMHNAMIQPNERDGIGWTMEWLNLPQLLGTTSGALLRAKAIIESTRFNSTRIQDNLDRAKNSLIAEAAVFALTEFITLAEAQNLVRSACQVSAQKGESLVEHLKTTTDHPVDWQRLDNPANYLGCSTLFINQIIEEWHSVATKKQPI